MNNKFEKGRFEKAVSLGIVLPESLGVAIQQLSSGLRFSTQELKSEKAYLRFVAMTTAVEAVENFMEHIPQFKRANLHLPFRELRKCLFMLKGGIELPEFALMRSPKSETPYTKFFKVRCALAMDLLMGAGRKRLDAARVVSRYLPEPKLKAETIASWRDNLTGNNTDPLSKDFNLKRLELRKMNLSEDDIKDFFKATTGDLRGVNLKRQMQRVVKRKKQY